MTNLVLQRFRCSIVAPAALALPLKKKPHHPFLAEKAEALGVPFGPERAKLVRGEAVTLADGRTIQPEEVVGPALRGTKYVHIGDVGRTEQLLEICQDADTLVIEATYLAEEAEMAHQFGHMTAAQAAHFAKAANVKTLILTHISRRYNGRMIREEARAIFPNTYVARDFDHFKITRDGAVKVRKDR